MRGPYNVLFSADDTIIMTIIPSGPFHDDHPGGKRYFDPNTVARRRPNRRHTHTSFARRTCIILYLNRLRLFYNFFTYLPVVFDCYCFGSRSGRQAPNPVSTLKTIEFYYKYYAAKLRDEWIS